MEMLKEFYLECFDIDIRDKSNLFETKRNSDFAEALMEFGALICKAKRS